MKENMMVRPAFAEDMDAIYLMGFDAWCDGQAEEAYLAGCRGSEKYKLGEWFCLTEGGVVVSSLITYKNQFGLADRFVGIGSIATHPDCRGNGYASYLIQTCIDFFVKEKYLGLLLFSDVEPAFYEKLGFYVVDFDNESALMFISLNGGKLTEPPSYF